VYLHYVFDLWIEAWRQKVATGDVIVVRYADDLVVVSKTERKPSDSWKHSGNDWPSLVWNYIRRRHD
jgi:hypothetical protein